MCISSQPIVLVKFELLLAVRVCFGRRSGEGAVLKELFDLIFCGAVKLQGIVPAYMFLSLTVDSETYLHSSASNISAFRHFIFTLSYRSSPLQSLRLSPQHFYKAPRDS